MNYLTKIEELNKVLEEEVKSLDSLSEDEAFQFIVDIRKKAYGEQGTGSISFFGNENIFPKLIKLGNKFIDNEKLLNELLRVLGIQTRFISYHRMLDINYNFLFKHKDHKNKKIQYTVSSYLFRYSNFQLEWEGKWGYILRIANIAPKKYTKDFFISSVYRNKNDIPNEYKSKFLSKIEQILDKGYIIPTETQIRYDELINILKNY